MSPVARRRAGVASGVVVAVAASSLTFFAVHSRGETVHEADLNDGGVWVSATNYSQFARMNKAARQFDAGIQANVTPGAGLDVVQDGAAVGGILTTGNQLVPIDPITGRIDSTAPVQLPQKAKPVGKEFVPATGDLRGGTLAMVDPKTGKVWAQRVDPAKPLSGLTLTTSAKPLATAGGIAAMAVDTSGGVHVVSAATGKVVSVPAAGDSFGAPVTEKIGLTASAVDITAVGTRWVVYNPVEDQVFAEGLEKPVAGGADRLGGMAYAALQQPGPKADSVALETTTELKVIGLDGAPGQAGVRLPSQVGPGAERPKVSRPVRLGDCVHAAWAQTDRAYYGANCGQGQTVTAGTLDKPGDVPLRDGMALRTNRNLIVLNDLDTGDAWDLDSKPLKIDNWDSVIPPSKTDDNNDDKDKNVVDDTTTPQPPKAEPDNLKVRAGRTSKLHVLDNDTDTPGSILAIAPGEITQPDAGGVTATVSGDGQSVDVSVPADPGTTSFSFSYQVNNGVASAHPRATVTVTVVADDVNSPPFLREGSATLATTAYPVVSGGRIPVTVIGDWRDPENDQVTAQPGDGDSLVDGLGRLVVQARDKAGSQSVPYTVDDGRRGVTPGKVTLAVLGDGNTFRAPSTQPDVVRGVVGKPLQIEPLGNDIAGADPEDPDAKMRLATDVRPQGSLSVVSDLDTGVVTITGATKGTFELTYAAQVGQGVAPGRIRIDLIDDPDPDAPPVAVPDSATVRDQTPVMADVLANDYSPRADVLATRSVAVDSDNSWLRPTIYQGRWVRVEALDPFTGGTKPRTGTVRYTISDGRKSTTGELTVTQRPTDPKALPIIQDDTAVVRAQDTVSIPVLDNDSMAEGIPLVLDPDSVKVLTKGEPQNAFASGNLVRYVPDPTTPVTVEKVVTIEYSAYPIGDPSKARSGRVSVTVKPLPGATNPNQSPVARSFSASVVAGEPLTITIPTSGVDPDGDTVTVQGISSADGEAINLSLGRVTGFGASTIKYEAYPRSAGTEVLNYTVADRFGGESTGFVRIGVVAPGDPQPPVAVEDVVRAAPGKTVTLDPTENDLIARGDSVDLLYRDLNPSASLSKWKIDAKASTFRTVVPPVSAGQQHLTYGIDNGVFDPSKSSITVVPVAGWKNRPVAVDDVAKPKGDETTALVDVLANDRDVDGDNEQLKVVSVLSTDASVEPGGRQVRVTVLDHPHTVPYVITDEDGQTAMALIYVPTGDNGDPFVVNGALIEMDRDSSKTVAIADYVKSPRARVVGITTPDTLSASPSDKLEVSNDGKNSLTLTSSGGYVGPGAVMLEVTDQENVQQKDFRTAYVSIPVQIGPKVPLLTCPDFAVSLVAGGRQRTLDIPTLCHAWLPPGLSLDGVGFEAQWQPESPGVSLDQEGQGGRQVALKAGRDAPSSTKGRVRIRPKGGEDSFVRVNVLGLSADPAKAAVDAKGDPLPVAPPPRMRPFSVTGLKAGSSATVDLRSYLDSPLDKPSCTVNSARIESGKGLTASVTGCTVTIQASGESSGSGSVAVSVSDGPGRNAVGRGSISVLGKPLAPGGVRAVADRVNGGTARVSWNPPTYDGGSPITSYTVTGRGPGAKSQRCSASPCTIGGLEDGKPYYFSVLATNGVGDSPRSPEVGPVKPDTLPNPVTGVRQVSRGDGTLTVTWNPPAKKGSDVRSYIVRFQDTTTGAIRTRTVAAPGVRASMSGLTNNHKQAVSVRARNDLGAGPFGPAVELQSAGTPPAVTITDVSSRAPAAGYDNTNVRITWNAVSPNGPSLLRYTVYRRVGSGAWTQLGTTPPGQRYYTDSNLPYDGRTYTYTVTATNGANKESAKANTRSFSSVGQPATPGAPSASTPRPDKTADVQAPLGDSRSSAFSRLEWESRNGGAVIASGFVSCGCAENSTKAFTTSGLGTTAGQRIRVRVFNGTAWSDWSPLSGNVSPYGTPYAPTSRGSSASGKTITYTWSQRLNGRAIAAFQASSAGTTKNLGSGARSVKFTYGAYDSAHSARVRMKDSTGRWSAWTTINGRTAKPPPSPSVSKPTKGSKTVPPNASGSCASPPGCPQVRFSISNFPAGSTWTVTCIHSKNGSYTSTERLRVRSGGSSYDWGGTCVSAVNGGTMKVRLSGGPGADRTSPAASW
ncbi:fibronectin type III domain-containing protein [Phycicoccus sp. Root101]|uniref:Ig-like domain-containing protein n=1 Tax=Phycicoccus sp. Root101 TaxID=1736421 RepID=UPI000B2F8475|nr:fibronectin type III domain-containing protein [Phycicoccus sp. Root101]